VVCDGGGRPTTRVTSIGASRRPVLRWQGPAGDRGSTGEGRWATEVSEVVRWVGWQGLAGAREVVGREEGEKKKRRRK
jgi:hypothetical protein